MVDCRWAAAPAAVRTKAAALTYKSRRYVVKHVTEETARLASAYQRVTDAAEDLNWNPLIFQCGADELTEVYPDLWNVDLHFLAVADDIAKSVVQIVTRFGY